jgi:pimeloyl-ACP methyl ester carboxylesterase
MIAASRWVTIPPLSLTRTPRRPGHPSAAGWITNRAPLKLTGAVFESSVRPIGFETVLDQARVAEIAGGRLLADCGKDPECAAQLPSTNTVELAVRLDSLASCRELGPLDAGRVKRALREGLRPFSTRVLVPAALRWILSCTPEGTRWFSGFVDEVTANASSFSKRSALGLYFDVALSEVDGSSVEAAALEAEGATWLFSDGKAWAPTNELLGRDDVRYAPDAFSKQWAETDVALLILHGDHDPQAPIDHGLELARRYAAPDQQFVEFRLFDEMRAA